MPGIIKIKTEALRMAIGLPDTYQIAGSVDVCSVWKDHIGFFIEGANLPEVDEGMDIPIVDLKLTEAGEVYCITVADDQKSDENNTYGFHTRFKCRHFDCNAERYSLAKG